MKTPSYTKTPVTLLRKVNLLAIASISLFATSISFAHPFENDADEETVRILANGNLTKVEQLFKNGMDINRDIDGDGTPLIIAVKNNNRTLVEYLIAGGADVNHESLRDGNPLIVAALTNNIDLVAYLYQQGAHLDAITKHDETALISASRAGHLRVVKLLVEQGADVNLAVEVQTVRGKELRSPLNGSKTQEIRDYLIANGAQS